MKERKKGSSDSFFATTWAARKRMQATCKTSSNRAGEKASVATKRRRPLLSAQARRAVGAGVLLAAFGAVVWLTGGVVDSVQSGIRVASAVEDVAGFTDVSSEADDTSSSVENASALPEWFADEVFPLESYADAQVTPEGNIAGFSVDTSVQEAFSKIAAQMEEKDWIPIASGIVGNGAFVKDQGLCRWIWVSCTDVADSTCVVMQWA